MTAMTRGPLPARVYWTRRVLFLLVVCAVVGGLLQVVSLAVRAGSPDGPDQATTVASEPTTSAPTPDDPADVPADETSQTQPRDETGKKQGKKPRKDSEPELAVPEGDCVDRDIAVTPVAEETVAGSPITFVLELRTVLTPACTWEVSPQSLTVKITSGDDDIWSTQQCERAIPRQDVVIRNNVSTEVEVTWSGRRSDDECSRLTDWALPGWYHIEAAALAGEPSNLQFQLVAPEPEVVTETVPPEPKQGEGKKRGDRNRDRGGQNDERRDGGRSN